MIGEGINPVPYKCRDDSVEYDTPDKALNAAPFKAGDVILVERFRCGRPYVAVAKILKVHSWFARKSLREWSVIYRVVMLRKDCTFSDNRGRTIRAYPGDVFRGYTRAGMVDGAGLWLGIPGGGPYVPAPKPKRPRQDAPR